MSYHEDRFIEYLGEQDGHPFSESDNEIRRLREMSKPENVKCPECDGEMVSRTGKFGVFWGCKNYPECKGTRDNMGRSKADREKWKAEQKTTDSIDLVNDDSIDENRYDEREASRFSFKKTTP